jgi:hypothetical protein
MTLVENNLAFTPRPIEAVGIRAAGVGVQIAQPVIQRMAALRAYSAFPSGRDWMEKLSYAYVVALATRSADIHLMRRIQSEIPQSPPFMCRKCFEATIGTSVIRIKLFPRLHLLRKHSNDLIHHLDHPTNQGIATLNIQGVFEYCYHLFQEQAGLFFGEYPDGTFEFKACKEHHQHTETKK